MRYFVKNDWNYVLIKYFLFYNNFSFSYDSIKIRNYFLFGQINKHPHIFREFFSITWNESSTKSLSEVALKVS